MAKCQDTQCQDVVQDLQSPLAPAWENLQLPDPEMQCQHFRQFCYHDVKGPQEVDSQLQELCHRWLKPEIHTKTQIMDLLVLEQFLTILPEEMQYWIWKHGPETCTEAVALAEGFQLGQPEAGRLGLQVRSLNPEG
uniref:SCAN box domain-containing protein n=1 Tax=Chelydra serpentina TaxID=8475 RepID=A0A8C3TGV6_CHESE